MKKIEQRKTKKDYLFILITTVLIVAFFVASIFIKVEKKEAEADDIGKWDETTISKLVINEIMTNNSGVYYDQNGTVDYIEIFNGKSEDIDLTGYGLSDKTDKVKWMFPDNTIIKSGEYLVVALTGNNEDGLYANFKLSSKGNETVILVNSSKKIIDAVDTVPLGKNQVMSRDNYGNWKVYDCPTPGYANNEAGYESYISSLSVESEDGLVINEFLCKNAGNYVNENGRLDGYIELKNISDDSINLAEYTLSNDINVPFRYQFEEVTLQPGEIYLLYAGDANYLQKGYTGFGLNNKNGSVILSKNGKIISTIDYNGLDNGLAMTRMSDGKYQKISTISPGYENTADGITQFQKKYLANSNDLIINEVMTQNDDYLAQNGGQYYDWIELYNNSNSAIHLSDYYLATNDTDLSHYQLPDVTLQSGQYYIIMASGDVNLSNNSYKHCDFKLSDTQSIYLSKNEKIIDCMLVSNVPYGYSYGRSSSDGYYYIETPTPGSRNNSGTRAISLSAQLTDAGIYNDISSLQVEMDGYGTIYYTTDGSEPNSSSKVYSGPIQLTETTVIRARCYSEGMLRSSVTTSSYIINENHTLAVVSISMEQSDFNYLNNYSYTTSEEAANIEFFDEDGSFNVGCSISLFGNNARKFEKKCYALRFDSEYGCSNLIYQVFENRDNSVYDALVLRQGSNDWARTIYRDALISSISDEYIVAQSYKACILYVNGEYQGIYNLREKINAQFISDRYNVSKESVTIVEANYVKKCGNASFYNEVVYYCQTHDMSRKDNYDYICTVLDIDNVIDFWITQMFSGNRDISNVRYFKSSQLDGGKWKYIFYDCDFGFSDYSVNYYSEYMCNPYGMTGWVENTYDNTIPYELFNNDEFVQAWIERLAYRLRNDLSKENLNNSLLAMHEQYASDLPRDRAMWQYSMDPIVEEYPTMSNYNTNYNMIKNFINYRQSYVLRQTKNWFGLSEAKMQEVFGDLW